MDRFKFRAWDKKRKELVLDACDIFPFNYLCDEKEFILMQCTGLKDKNDKLIYEGDIMEEKYGYADGSSIIATVMFGEHPDDEDYNYHLGFFLSKIFTCPLNKDVANKLEIIGNIYENAELLK